jgi:hypothetical protein
MIVDIQMIVSPVNVWLLMQMIVSSVNVWLYRYKL